MDAYPHEAWARLGDALTRRRGQLGYGFRRRTEFAQRAGLSPRTARRLEKAERDSYPPETLALAEWAYQWEPGSVEIVLRGGAPVLRPDSQGASRAQAGQRYYDDPHLQAIWDDGRLPEDVRLGMIRLAQKALRQPGENQPPNGGAA